VVDGRVALLVLEEVIVRLLQVARLEGGLAVDRIRRDVLLVLNFILQVLIHGLLGVVGVGVDFLL